MQSLQRLIDSPVPDDVGELPTLFRARLPRWVRFRRWLNAWTRKLQS